MKRPLCLCALSLAAGIAAAYFANSILFVILSILVLVFAAAVIYARFGVRLLVPLCLVLFYSAGALEFTFTDAANISKYSAYSGKQVVIKGFIDSEPDIRETKVSYFVNTYEINSVGKTGKVNGRLLLTMPGKDGMRLYDYGSGIEINGTLNLPKGRRNPGGFNYRRYLAASGAAATVFALEDRVKADTGSSHGNILVRAGLVIRHRIVETIGKSLPAEQAGLLSGMLIGYRDGLDRKVQEYFSDAGLSHIMAASGMNVAFIVLPLLFLFKRLHLGQRAANALTIAILIVFLFVTGFSPSILRAVIMAVIILTGQIIRREAEVLTSLSIAAILMLLGNPFTLFDIGFQLSFAATLSLVLFYKKIRSLLNFRFLPGFIAEIIAVTLAAQVGVLPISTFYFNKISLVSLLTNLLVVPLVQIITVLGFVMAILGQVSIIISRLIGYVNYMFLTFILLVTRLSADIPYGVVRVVTPSIFLILAYYATVFYFLRFRAALRNWLRPSHFAAISGIIALAVFVPALLPGNLEIVFIDVGQGDSALVRTCNGKTVLVDGGGRSTTTDTTSNIGESVIIPLLLDAGVARLDMVIATHGHDDHIQGLLPVLSEFGTGVLVIPDCRDKKELAGLLDIAAGRNISVKACAAGDSIKLDDSTDLNILHPQRSVNLDKSPVNNESLVFRLSYKDLDVLFAGDIEKEAEWLLVDQGIDLSADVLKVAHHGSPYSSTDEFIDRVEPKAAVISVGPNNFGHPSGSVLERLRDGGIRIYRTDESGAVVLTSNGEKVKIKTVAE